MASLGNGQFPVSEKQGTGHFPVSEKEGTGHFPVSQKQGTGHFPVSQKQGIGQFPVLNEICQFFLCIRYLTKKNCMLSFFQIINTQMDISVSFFALIQCYWLEDGEEVLENSLRIPR